MLFCESLLNYLGLNRISCFYLVKYLCSINYQTYKNPENVNLRLMSTHDPVSWKIYVCFFIVDEGHNI